eukprot:TRINITY_DN3985_c0_g1_i1.p1 TRINITY_DN3985_c0_g1~~TRINITY_DN3985_c0_g1_i1.p1  ORF type:complete len:180 (+),score=40.15 TRINITY_DN3985_c0_g1_i1:173-712(+)
MYHSSDKLFDNKATSRNSSHKFHNTSALSTPLVKQQLIKPSYHFEEFKITSSKNKDSALLPKSLKKQARKDFKPIHIKPLEKLKPKALPVSNESLMDSVTEPSESLNIGKSKLEEVRISIDLYDSEKPSKRASNCRGSNSVSKKRGPESKPPKIPQKREVILKNKHSVENGAVSIFLHS